MLGREVVVLEQNRHGAGMLRRVRILSASALFGAVLALAVLLGFAAAAVSGGSLHRLAGVSVYCAGLAGGFCAGFTAARRMGRNGLLNGACASLGSAGLLWLASLLPAEPWGTATPVAAVVCVTGGLIGGLAGVNLFNR